MKAGYQALLLIGLLIATLVPSSILARFYSPSKAGVATNPSKIKDYEKVKPEFAPPNAVFGVVWPILYILQAVALWLVLRNSKDLLNGNDGDKAIMIGLPILFGLQLILNYVWMVVFYQGDTKAYKDALWILVALVLFVVWIWVLLLKTNTLAAFLWTPYPLWIMFAIMMNARIVTKSSE